MTPPSFALNVRGLSKDYPRATHAVLALRDVSFQVRSGEFVCIVGPSGCGKSTLLSLIAGLDAPSRGQLLLDEKPIAGPGPDRGMIFQKDCLFPWLTVLENVEFASHLSGHQRKADDRVAARAGALLSQVGLDGFAASYPRQLSGGMRQRAAIARALLYQPRILLMDEPFGALDAQTREQMQELVLRLCAAHGTTVLFVTHDVEEATFLADRVLVMAAHPGWIAREVAVPLARPRHRGVKLSPDFTAVRGEVLAALHGRQRDVA
jgi:NitT/TauT family transport system ATP-binding protein